MNLSNYQERVTRVCFAAVPSEEDLNTLGHKERWLTYRRMVRTRLTGVVRTALPRTCELLGDEFAKKVAAWFAEHPPASRIFHRVPSEFARFVLPALPAPQSDLLRFELAVWSLRAVVEERPPVTELSFEAPIALQSALEIIHLTHSSHLKGDDAFNPGPVCLLLYRNDEHRVMTLRINPVAEALLRAWMEPHESLASAVRAAAANVNATMGTKFMDSLGGLLADYLQRGIVLGSRPTR
ncbi:MAG: putative DNA-binding domain-containing protein [Polyangiales bacterium]